MLRLFKKNKRKRSTADEIVQMQREYFDISEAKELLEDIKKEYGLDYSKQEFIVVKKLERFALKNGLKSFGAMSEKISMDAELKRALINMLTVGETYFYREFVQFDMICKYIQKRGYKKILSAPCSSGEEVYSLLLALKESDIHIPSSFRVVGIDINTKALRYAQRGCFTKRSVSYLEDRMINAYFTKCDSEYCIDSYFKQFARFYHQNIFDIDVKDYGKFDVILSRNMLIYFNDEQKREALRIFYHLLNENGILLLGHADISFEPTGFKKHYEDGVVFYTHS